MALKEHFWGQKYTFKIKKPGSRANGRKVGSQIAIQKIKISPTSKTCDTFDMGSLNLG